MWPIIVKLVVNESPASANYLLDIIAKHPNSINDVTGLGSTPLHFACLRDDPEIASILIQHGADVNARNIYNETPLHWACKHGNVSIVNLLLASGVNANKKDTDGDTPLKWAKQENNIEIVNLLKQFQKTENKYVLTKPATNVLGFNISSLISNIIQPR